MASIVYLSHERANTLLEALREALALANAEETYRRHALILQATLSEATERANILLPSPFARMEFICRELKLSPLQRHRLNAMRSRLSSANSLSANEKRDTCSENDLSLRELIAALAGIPMPKRLLAKLEKDTSNAPARSAFADTARMVVTQWDERFAYGELEDGVSAKLHYAVTNHFGDWSYLNELFFKGMMLSLIRPTQGDDEAITADLIVCLPDLLINITSITGCITPVGSSPLWHLLNLFAPSPSSVPILLGNLSGQLLDARLHQKDDAPVDYDANVRRFFQHNALKILQLRDDKALRSFHKQGRAQLRNIDSIITHQLPELQGYDLDKVVLEPSILCSALGLQGRMDFLQSDFKVLIEQKSGKCDEWRTNMHPEAGLVCQQTHYAQLLLYRAMLRYGLRIPNDAISGALLYSKYPRGLVGTGPAPKFLQSCITLRNSIAALEFRMARGDFKAIIDAIETNDFNRRSPDATIWTVYTLPKVKALLDPLRSAPPLALAYFHRFATFVCRERLLARIGAAGRQLESFAAIWCAPTAEKLEAGTMLAGLTIASLQPSKEGNGVEKIVLNLPTNTDICNANFRRGDIVMLHAYAQNSSPCATSGIIFRGSMEQFTANQTTIALRAPQRNEALFNDATNRLWAMEHDHYDIAETQQLQSLFALLNAPRERQALLLAERQPRIDTSQSLRIDHAQPNGNCEFNDLALRAVQARDIFLVVGPPGTGKTSFGLMCILREELARPDTNVLLLAFTNRAVDEICSKLEKDNRSYLRIGSRLGCAENYRGKLLREATKGCSNVKSLHELIDRTRIFTSTISAILGTPELLKLKRFSLAIIDEASQVIEPNLVSLICAMQGKTPAIERFVLIGDQRQLPAVVLQSYDESAVNSSELQPVGLRNCRESLFERLYQIYEGNEKVIYHLSRQGRMHPAIADFPNRMFYGNRLLPVPLPHQKRQLALTTHSPSRLHALLCRHRTLFFNVPPSHDDSPSRGGKANAAEAKAIAQIICACFEIYQASNKSFSPAEQIGVIVPYRNQIAQIRHELHSEAKSLIPDHVLENISIDTVERFQGSERDIIIYGLTAQHEFQLQFLAESRTIIDNQEVDRKLNVALTRAKEQMFVVGNATLLRGDCLYSQLIDDYASRQEAVQWHEFGE